MKILAIGKQGKVFKIGENEADSKWFVTDEVADYTKNIKRGDEVEIKSRQEGRDNYLTYIKVLGSPEQAAPSAFSAPKTYASSGRSPDINESIRKQAIMHAVSRTLIGLQGQFDMNNVLDYIDVLYKKYESITK